MKQKHCDGYPWDFHCPIAAEYALKNGEEVRHLCEHCFREELADLVTSNDSITFWQTDEKQFEVD